MDRHLAFDRAVNFRDMGGYATQDGRCTRWRHLYRSGHLARVTPEDMAKIDGLNLGAVFDFRAEHERQKEPNLCQPTAARVHHHLPIWPKTSHSNDALITGWVAQTLTAGEVMAVQDESYRLFVLAHTAEYAALFREILARDGKPLLIHCAGGKDRTGLAAALILMALGVPEETATADYMTSADSKSLVRYIEGLAAKHPAGQKMYGEAMHLFGVRRERLHCAFAAARGRNGSLEGYLADALGLGRRERDTLKSWYLE